MQQPCCKSQVSLIIIPRDIWGTHTDGQRFLAFIQRWQSMEIQKIFSGPVWIVPWISHMLFEVFKDNFPCKDYYNLARRSLIMLASVYCYTQRNTQVQIYPNPVWIISYFASQPTAVALVAKWRSRYEFVSNALVMVSVWSLLVVSGVSPIFFLFSFSL